MAMEPYPAPLSFRSLHRRDYSDPNPQSKNKSVFDDDGGKDGLFIKRDRSRSWLSAAKKKPSSPAPDVPVFPRSMPANSPFIKSAARFSSDSSDSADKSSNYSSSSGMASSNTSPSLSSSPMLSSTPPKRPPRPEHGLFDDADFYNIHPALRPTRPDYDGPTSHPAQVDVDLDGQMSDNVEQLMLEVDQAFEDVGVALKSAKLGRPSLGPQASPPVSRAPSVKKRRRQYPTIQTDLGSTPQFTAPTRKTSVSKRRTSQRPVPPSAKIAQQLADKKARWTMTESLVEFVRRSPFRRVEVDEILSPRRMEDIRNSRMIEYPFSMDAVRQSSDSKEESHNYSLETDRHHPSHASFRDSTSTSEDHSIPKPPQTYSDRVIEEAVLDERSASPTAPALPPKNPARFNRKPLHLSTIPESSRSSALLVPARKPTPTKTKETKPDVNLAEFQSAIICGAGDLETGLAEDEEQDMLDEMTEWFDEFGFETPGQLIVDGPRRRGHQRDTSRSIESVQSLDSTTSTISTDSDLPIMTTSPLASPTITSPTLSRSKTSPTKSKRYTFGAEGGSPFVTNLSDDEKIVVGVEIQRRKSRLQKRRTSEAKSEKSDKVRMSCNLTNDLDSFLESTPVPMVVKDGTFCIMPMPTFH